MKTMDTTEKSAILFVDGEKGGVGKSLFTKVLLHHLELNEVDISLVDTDTNHDVADVYKGRTDISFTVSRSEAESDPWKMSKVDELFEAALEKPVVVNLPANVHRHVADWIEENDILDLCKSNDIGIYKWFLSNGSYHSVSLFADSMLEFEGKLPHVFVRNKGVSEDWSNLKNHDGFNTVISECSDSMVDIEFPKLRFVERDCIEQYGMTFLSALLSPEDYEMKILSQQRLTKFLREAGKEIKRTGILSNLLGYEGIVDVPAQWKKAKSVSDDRPSAEEMLTEIEQDEEIEIEEIEEIAEVQ